MDDILKKPYEISIWEDELVTDENDNKYYKENKIAVIGSNTMTAMSKVYEPVFKENTNGEKTLTFSLKYQYFDPLVGAMVTNPFASYLVNERKVKLHYDEKWYDFIIKEHVESSDGLTWTYTARDAFINELSKNGYNIEFSADLNNNQGTAIELAKKTLENTDWKVAEDSTIGPQQVSEPVYKATLIGSELEIIKALDGTLETFEDSVNIYLFYSYVANQNGKFVQFILQNQDEIYNTDDNNCIIADNYRILNELTYDSENRVFKFNDTTVITIGKIETSYQAYRMAYNQLTTYDPVIGRTVQRYTAEGLEDKEVYSYTDYVYSTSSVLTNLLTNGDNFNIYEDGSLQGWRGVVEYEADKEKPEVGLVTYPEISATTPLSPLDTFAQIEGFMEVKFPGNFSEYKNGIFNSGFEDNTSIIQSISSGQQFVFRWRAAKSSERHGTLSPLNDGDLRVVVAKYSKSEKMVNGAYVNIVDQDNILLDFNGERKLLNNTITGGTLQKDADKAEDDSAPYTKYVIDSVVQEPSTKYVYISNDTEYVWDKVNSKYILKSEASNFLDYYYMTATAAYAIPNTILSDPTERIGIFIYTNNAVENEEPVWYYFQDVQLTRLYRNTANDEIITVGNIPTSTSIGTTYYYVQPDTSATAASVRLYVDTDSMGVGTITPKYNKNSEKVLSISVSKSNCFNILQTIAETFECWLDLEVERDDNGAIKLDENHVPNKVVRLKEYVGNNNEAGFKYGINLDTIERTVNSDEIVTKLIVDPAQSDYVDTGAVSIQLADSNPTGESYILNFDYYYNQKLVPNEEECKNDVLEFSSEVKEINNEINELESQYRNLDAALLTLNSKRNVFTELIDTAKDTITKDMGLFEKITGISYQEYQEKTKDLTTPYNFPTEDTEVDESKRYYTYEEKFVNYEEKATVTRLPETEENVDIYTLTSEEKQLYIQGKLDIKLEGIVGRGLQQSWSIDTSSDDYVVSIWYLNEHDEAFDSILKISVKESVLTEITNTDEVTNPQEEGLYEHLDNYLENETIIDIVGEIYTCSAAINNYAGILTNIEEEYKSKRKQLNGTETFDFTVTKVREEGTEASHIQLTLSDYVIPFRFRLGDDENETIYESSVSKKYFDIITDYNTVTIVEVPQGYKVINPIDDTEITTITVDEGIQTFTIKPDVEVPGIRDEIEEKQKQKEETTNNFYKKYSRFIQEGTWSATDYIDSELYYLDALQVSNTSAQPQVSYTINVVEISEIEGFEGYNFKVGDKTYIEDTEFFGWAEVKGVLTPAREEVIVSEVEWHLDEPDKNVITIQNYKTRFEDLFQRISATVQTVQYNEATYAKTTSIINPDGTIKENVLLSSWDNIAGKGQKLTSDGSVYISGGAIVIQNLTNSSNLVKIDSEGIRTSSDGGVTWSSAITGNGTSADSIRSGMINTDEILIGNSDAPSFRWDKAGISAYRNDTTVYDLKTYVRYDQYGLYGIKNGENFVAESLEDVKDNAHFAVTWDGFFIKNSYEDGGRVSITSDNDFQVIDGNDTERIKIGSLGVDPLTNERIYGINISDNLGNSVLNTDNYGNLTVSGTINANAGEFSGHIHVGTGDPYIAIDGADSSIYSSNYSESTGIGWKIDKDGDAYFNNITARGAIKTAVFEYAEIQAVGGIFIFRPSSTIKEAEVSGNDLILTVEKPLLFKVGQWCKISNYANGNDTEDGEATNPDASNILLTNGLTHVYPVASINGKEITLTGAKKLLTDTDKTKEELAGGALVDMGDKANGDGEIGNSNYGIGINSSDNTVNLPRRAISLFETVIDETKNPKISYKYRGILGTLPTLPTTDVSDSIYNQNMAGSQGIYTDNMYLGDKSKYIAFYTDEDNKKQLRVAGADIIFTYTDAQGGVSEKTLDERIDEIEAGTGEDAINVEIDSSAGNIFINGVISTILRCYVYKGGVDITHDNAYIKTYTWKKINIIDGSEVQGWTPTAVALEPNAIRITADDVDSKAVFQCMVDIEEA